MPALDLNSIWPIVHLIWSAVKPSLRAAALAELKDIAAAHESSAILEAIIAEAEVLVAAA